MRTRYMLLGALLALVIQVCTGASPKIRDYQIAFGTPGSGNVSFDDFTDVNLAGQASGDLLTYNGSSWIPDDIGSLGLTNYWARASTVLSPATSGDSVRVISPDTTGALYGKCSAHAGIGVYGSVDGSGANTLADIGVYGQSTSSNNQAYGVFAAGNLGIQGYLDIGEATAPATPDAGIGRVYFKSSDSRLYYKTDGGIEYGPLSSGGGSSPLTTKGDIYTYSTVDARLAVGSNGQRLVADSTQTTGLRWDSLTLADVGSSTSAELAAVISDETGSGKAVFAVSPSFTTPAIGAATGDSVTVTGDIRTSSSANPLGYNSGAGGTAVQGPAKTSAVTLNKTTGTITMAALGAVNAGAEVSFTVNNSSVAATDVIVVNHASGGTAGAYCVMVTNVAAGSFQITVSNWTAGNLTEAPVLAFAVIKGQTS